METLLREFLFLKSYPSLMNYSDQPRQLTRVSVPVAPSNEPDHPRQLLLQARQTAQLQ